VKQSILIFILLGGLLLMGCSKFSKKSVSSGPQKSDPEFAKDVFNRLATGDAAVADMLDWEHLTMTGIDAGALYRGIKDESARETFRKSFIDGYANSFKRTGGSPAVLLNWREQSKDGTNTTVAADGPNGKVLIMTVAHIDGEQKVSSLDIK
jgi:hypothetical protein